MEPINEILKLVKQEYLKTRLKSGSKSSIYPGLCNLVYKLYQKGLITIREHNLFITYLFINRPKRVKSNSIEIERRHCNKHPLYLSEYLWEHDYMKPRLAWLTRHIKKTA